MFAVILKQYIKLQRLLNFGGGQQKGTKGNYKGTKRRMIYTEFSSKFETSNTYYSSNFVTQVSLSRTIETESDIKKLKTESYSTYILKVYFSKYNIKK
jgi:hypothetical protein